MPKKVKATEKLKKYKVNWIANYFAILHKVVVKLRDGEAVDIPNDIADEMVSQGYAEEVKDVTWLASGEKPIETEDGDESDSEPDEEQ